MHAGQPKNSDAAKGPPGRASDGGTVGVEFDAFVRNHDRELKQFVARRLRGHSCDVEDVTQRVWERLYRVLARPTNQRLSLEIGLLYFVATSELHVYFRSMVRQARLQQRLVHLTPPEPSVPRVVEAPAQFLAALNGLADSERSLLELRFAIELPSHVIARILDLSDDAVRQRTSRAAIHLRRLALEQGA